LTPAARRDMLSSRNRAVEAIPANIAASFAQVRDGLQAVRELNAKLMREPSPAAERLVAALQDVSTTFAEIELQLNRFLGLDLSSENSRAAARTALLVLEGGAMYDICAAYRAHCSFLRDLFENHLERWFSNSSLTQHEYARLYTAFQTLFEWDDVGVIPLVMHMASLLTERAQRTLSLLDSDDPDGAIATIRAARLEVLPLREALWKTSGELRDLGIQYTYTPTIRPAQGFPT
jgi:hypothetical protein